MKRVTYEDFALDYEITRDIDLLVYPMLCSLLAPTAKKKILDFGCGTGHYLKALIDDFGIDAFGVEPCDAMRKIASEKDIKMKVLAGNDELIPYPPNFFDAIFITDVIHHINNLKALLKNTLSITKVHGIFCICTESPVQIMEKYWISYFPSIAKIDEQRFHCIESVINLAINLRWDYEQTVTIEDSRYCAITNSFMTRVEQRLLSVLQLISNEEFEKGLIDMKQDYNSKVLMTQREGYTYILLKKGGI